MLTVLMRYRKTRRECLFEAESVEFIPPGTPKVNEGIDQPGLLVNHGVAAKKGFHLDVTPEGDENWRDVFVMNSEGQTVARYTI